ncbi:MAG: hypothetical protein EHM48_09995 [Planctomycetaceae bacterium]|nr:MAG: hypothetical protein EHM48_09995 [Planctomycetaceae bacterium]
MSNSVTELFGRSTIDKGAAGWAKLVQKQACPFLAKKCLKVRKSQPKISIGTCSVNYGRDACPIIICPFRLLERRQVFTDALHLLTLHEPGNELHVVPEVSIPGGSVDYFLVSARRSKPIDFVGIELQTLDTTGTVWPARQAFLDSIGVDARIDRSTSQKTFGMNWKMTAKTILVQLHHKVETFEHVSKRLVCAVQDCLLAYMRREFNFGHLNNARNGDSMQFHAYSLESANRKYRIRLTERCSTDAAGISTALGLQAQANVDLDVILAGLERKMSDRTLWMPV